MKHAPDNMKTIPHQINSADVGFLHQESTVKLSNLLLYFLLVHLFFGVTGMNASVFNASEITQDIAYSSLLYWFVSFVKNCSPSQKKRAVKNFNENRPNYKKTVVWLSCLVLFGVFAYFIHCDCSVFDSILVSMLFASFAYLSALFPDFIADIILNRPSLFLSKLISTPLPITKSVFFTRVTPVPTRPAIQILAA